MKLFAIWKRSHPNKWEHQLRRAGYLIGALDTIQADAETKARFADHLTLTDWQHKVAVIADQISDRIGDPNPRFAVRPPSAETVAIARAHLRYRAEHPELVAP